MEANEAATTPSPRGDARVAVRLALLAFAVFALINCGYVDNIDSELQHHCAARLVDEGTLAVGDVPRGLQRLAEPGRDGTRQMQFGIGSVLPHLPAVAAARVLGGSLGADSDKTAGFLASFSGPAFAAAALAAIFLLARRLGLSRGGALLAAALHGGATYALVYARSSYYETPIAMLLAFAAVFATDPRRRNGTAVAAGALVGLAITFKIVWAIAVPPFLVLLAGESVRDRVRRAAVFLVPVAASLGVVAAWNAWRFGDPFVTGYTESLARPLGDGLHRLLLGAHASCFLFSPVLLLAPAGLVLLWKRGTRAYALFAAGLSVAVIGVYAMSFWPEGGNVHGPRYLLPLTPFLAIAAAAFVATRAGGARIACVALVVASVLVQLPGVLVAHQEYYRVQSAMSPAEQRALPPYLAVQAVLAREKLLGRDDPYDLALLGAAPGTTLKMTYPPLQGINWWWIRGARNYGRPWMPLAAVPFALAGLAAGLSLRRELRNFAASTG